ncbi:MAG: hypothetical protein WCX65_14820 [bacterium]
MLRKFAQMLGMVMLPVCLIIAGCAAPPEKGAIPGAENLPPNEMVDRLFAAIQFNELESAENYFTSQAPENLAKKFIADFAKTRAIGQFKTKTISVVKNKAVVKALYNYDKKDPKTGEITTTKKIEELKQFEMVKEGKYWKIRRTGFPAFDMKVEESLFYDCLNTVMDITIAEEKLHQRRPTYTDSIAALNKVYKINDAACANIRIEQAGKTTYWVVARSRNLIPCEITANTDKHSPMSFDECPTK